MESMKKQKHSKKGKERKASMMPGTHVPKWVYWTPRIVSIAFLCFLALFSLDVFEPGLTWSQIALGLLMHNIPVFILLAVLIISWKHEWVGGIVFILAGLLYVLLTFFRASIPWYIALSWSMTIAGPAFLIGALFFVNWFKKDRKKPQKKVSKKSPRPKRPAKH